MNVLSLFDGMSCGQIALSKLGITPDNYYASEIDRYAIQVTKHNFPNTKHLGDITKWESWDIPWETIDLVTGGFPCQAWSIAGKQMGDKDARGMLFWTMLDIMKKVLEHNPKAHFLIENVKMKREFEEYITFHTEQALGHVHKTLINSALVSAQNRQRYYWTNFMVTQPEDLGIKLKDILENGVVDRDKSYCVDACYYKGGNPEQYFEKSRRQLVFRPCEPVVSSGNSECIQVATATDINGHDILKRVYSQDGKSPTLNSMGGGNREPKVLVVPEATVKGYTEISPGECVDLTFIMSKTRRGRKMHNKSNCLTATTFDYGQWDGYAYRKLIPLECERLQTVPDCYTLVLDSDGKQLVSNSQRYKMLGNGWTVDVISHILKGVINDLPQV